MGRTCLPVSPPLPGGPTDLVNSTHETVDDTLARYVEHAVFYPDRQKVFQWFFGTISNAADADPSMMSRAEEISWHGCRFSIAKQTSGAGKARNLILIEGQNLSVA